MSAAAMPELAEVYAALTTLQAAIDDSNHEVSFLHDELERMGDGDNPDSPIHELAQAVFEDHALHHSTPWVCCHHRSCQAAWRWVG
jgi:hypothetical protein